MTQGMTTTQGEGGCKAHTQTCRQMDAHLKFIQTAPFLAPLAPLSQSLGPKDPQDRPLPSRPLRTVCKDSIHSHMH